MFVSAAGALRDVVTAQPLAPGLERRAPVSLGTDFDTWARPRSIAARLTVSARSSLLLRRGTGAWIGAG